MLKQIVTEFPPVRIIRATRGYVVGNVYRLDYGIARTLVDCGRAEVVAADNVEAEPTEPVAPARGRKAKQ